MHRFHWTTNFNFFASQQTLAVLYRFWHAESSGVLRIFVSRKVFEKNCSQDFKRNAQKIHLMHTLTCTCYLIFGHFKTEQPLICVCIQCQKRLWSMSNSNQPAFQCSTHPGVVSPLWQCPDVCHVNR